MSSEPDFIKRRAGQWSFAGLREEARTRVVVVWCFAVTVKVKVQYLVTWKN